VQICKAICFVAADWSLFARPIEMDRVQVLWPCAGCYSRRSAECCRAALGQRFW